METNIRAIVILLLTQAMINLGEVEHPLEKNRTVNMKGARIFIDLLNVLRSKTRGNLSTGEKDYLDEVIENVETLYTRKKKV